MKNVSIIALLFAALTILSCDKNSIAVPDPEGTIELKMRNTANGWTWLMDAWQIGKDNNFYGRGRIIVNVGKVKGVGNITRIPISGWAEEMAVVPGNGYILTINGDYYRVYVVSYIKNTSGGIMGATIRYQGPFYGEDEEWRLGENNIEVPSRNQEGLYYLPYNNSTVMPFTASYSDNWMEVIGPISINNNHVLNKIGVYYSDNESDAARTGTVTLTNHFGRKTTITVTQKGRE